MSKHTHYELYCPLCKAVTEGCQCPEAWKNSYPARIPCKTCTGKLAAEFSHEANSRPFPNKKEKKR